MTAQQKTPAYIPLEWSEWMARFEEVSDRVITGVGSDATKAAYDLWKAGQTPEQGARRIYGVAK